MRKIIVKYRIRTSRASGKQNLQQLRDRIDRRTARELGANRFYPSHVAADENGRRCARTRRDDSDSRHETTRTGEISHANIIVRVSEVSFRNLCSAGRMGDYVKRCVSGYSGREARRNRDTAR